MNNMTINKEEFKEQLANNVKSLFRKTVKTASNVELYKALVFTIRSYISDNWVKTHDAYDSKGCKVVCYLSMEFLMGRFLGNAVLNMCANNTVSEALEELGIDYNALEDVERDPGLGNGGLGRLAACFLDSLSTLELPAYGCGIRYHYGIFEQKIENGYQVEKPDNWLKDGDVWGVERQEYAVDVNFFGDVKAVKKENGEYKFIQENCQTIVAIPHDYPVVGYGNKTVNTLRLWDAQPKAGFDLKSFNAGDYSKAVEQENMARTITEVLYPADEHYAGKELRLRQQYFFVSATLQRVIAKFKELFGNDFSKLPEKYAFQLNDTHPSIAVAELMRILVDENDLPWDEAWEITTKCCAYTNHTIMSEALEKWPIELFSRLLPRIYMIVEEINRRFCDMLISKFGNNPEKIRKMAIVADGQIRMAWLAIVGSHSVNGVAALHTEILKNQELRDFYEIYPEKFNNKTNGITQRRWLGHANSKLASLITNKVGEGWEKDLTKLKGLEKLADDPIFQAQFMDIKKENKIALADYLKKTTGVEINPDSIFDIQVKRLHEYKRQLLNVLHVLSLYNKLKVNPGLDIAPRTFIFGAKSAAGYRMAKLIIKLINSVADLVNNDETIEGKIKVIFAENYRVTLAEKLIPAADVSEQISTASKEASGTGNMKFMLNGALTLGTMDGANVEIVDEVGEENAFIFGLSSDEVINYENNGGYNPMDIFNSDMDIRKVLMQLINGFYSPDDPERFRPIYNSLLNTQETDVADRYFILKDFKSYAAAQKRVEEAYRNEEGWAKSAMLNVANVGKFTSDRTIEEYVQDIWHLEKVKVKMDV